MIRFDCARTWCIGLAMGIVVALCGQPVFAQTAAGLLPPTVSARDSNGVDLISGKFSASLPSITAGSNGSGLARSISGYNLPWGDNFTAVLNTGSDTTGSFVLVSTGSNSEKFYGSTAVTTSSTPVTYTPEVAGNTFVCASSSCTYTMSDGSVAVFDETITSNIYIKSGLGAMTSLTKPDGEVLTLNYKRLVTTTIIPGVGNAVVLGLRSVSSSLGWMIKYELGVDPNTLVLSNIHIINTSVDYCSPTTDALCTAAGSDTWPTMTPVTNGWSYALRSATQADPVYTATTTTDGGSPISTSLLAGFTTPTGVSTNATFTSGVVQSVTSGGQTWNYTFSTVGTIKTGTATSVTDPAVTRVVTSDTATSQVLSVKDELGRVTKYNYYTTTDAAAGALKGKVSQVLAPDFTGTVSSPTGGYTQNKYNVRGNITTTTVYPKTSGTPIVSSATYPVTCTSAKTCNKPLTVTDANGVVTTYTYHTASGNVATISTPAVGGVAAQTRYDYAQITPQIKNSSGVLVNAAPVWRLTTTTACMNTASCDSGTHEDELKTVTTYGTANVLPTQVTVTHGNPVAHTTSILTTTTTYDSNGNTIVIDGPQSGSVDEIYYFYDGLNRQVGEVTVDPDGATTNMKRKASRTSYDGDGHVINVETGAAGAGATAAYTGTDAIARWAQAQTDWLAMTVLQHDTNTFSTTTGLPIVARHYDGSTLTALSQRSYDNFFRLDCEATRLNPAIYATVTATATCSLATAGPDGNDQIVKYSYDKGGKVLSTISAYGIAGVARTDFTKVYDNTTGTLTYVTDAKSNKTSYTYDNFNRMIKTCYPLAATGGTSSTTDCEQTTYSGARVNTSIQRDGQTTTMVYDAVGRVFSTTGAIAQSFTYDNFDQVKTHTQNGFTHSYIYDTAGLVLSDTQPAGTITYAYDAYGKRNKMTYPDGFYVTYDYWADDSGWYIRDNTGVYMLRHEFDDYGRLKTKKLGNSSPYPVQTTPGYDARSRMTGLTSNLSTTAATTAYDITSTFGFTEGDQIKSRVISNAGYEMPAPTIGTSTYTINGLNQVAAKTGSPNFTYDGRGNLTSDGSSTTYGYNASNLLTSVVTGAVTTTVAYDAENRLYRIAKAGNAATRFLYDGQDLIAEYNDAGVLQRRYVHGFGIDEPVVAYYGAGTADADRYYLVADERGSIIAVTNSAGDIGAANTSANAYDAYGLPDAGNVGRFQYTGQTWLPEIGLYYYKARMYAPSLGRFLQTDPIGYGDGMNMYAYVHGDPVNDSDPSGLDDRGRPAGYEAPPQEIIVTGRRPDHFFDNMAHYADIAGQYLVPGYDLGKCVGGIFVSSMSCNGSQWTGATLSAGADVAMLAVGGPVLKVGGKVAEKLLFKAGVKLVEKLCFAAGTEIATPTGLKNIEDVKVGDLVLSYDEQTGQISARAVTELIRNTPQATYEVRLKSSQGDLDIIRVTAEHPWLTASHQWTGTKDLHAGDKIETAQGENLTLISIEATGKVEQVYNFAVTDTHTYLVGKNHAIVHNTCWLRVARTLQEKMALDAAKSGAGKRIIANLGDNAYKGMDKMEYVVKSNDGVVTTVHYVRDPATGALMDFKFISTGNTHVIMHR